MREVKFRFWDEENKEMIDGDNLAFEEYLPIKDLLSQDGIMQFTGLHDKSGKEIYEGDIIQVIHPAYPCNKYESGIFIVRFQYGQFDIFKHRESKIENNEMVEVGFSCCENIYKANETKAFNIIGNIYENPDLLTEKDKENDKEY